MDGREGGRVCGDGKERWLEGCEGRGVEEEWVHIDCKGSERVCGNGKGT